MKTIGVLALQGAFKEHISMLEEIGVHTKEVRLPIQLESLDGLIIPGGESTSQAKLMDFYGFRETIIKEAIKGLPIWGTCAGLILMAKNLEEAEPKPLGLIDIDVKRNAYGRQANSFQSEISILLPHKEKFPAIFIRAPQIQRTGENIEVIATLNKNLVVGAREGKMMVTAFHPELGENPYFHKYFLHLIGKD